MRWYSGIIVSKDPDAVIDWRWEWEDWLGTGDSISTDIVTADAGITVDSDTINGTGVDVILSGGTVGTTYAVAVKITTANGLTDERTVNFQVVER